jgi:DsbC/DsbD-like thiol-disulfide interchange protein
VQRGAVSLRGEYGIVMRQLFHHLMACGMILGLAPAAWGQFPGGFGGFREEPVERLQSSLVVREGELVAGQEGTLGIVMDVQQGWKIQAGQGSGDEVEGYVPTTIQLELPENWQAGPILWPRSKRFEFGDENWSEVLAVYDQRSLAAVKVQVPADTEPGEYTVGVRVGYQACDDATCEAPTSKRFEQTVRVLAAGEQPAPAIDADMSAAFDAVLARAEEMPPEESATEGAARGGLGRIRR